MQPPIALSDLQRKVYDLRKKLSTTGRPSVDDDAARQAEQARTLAQLVERQPVRGSQILQSLRPGQQPPLSPGAQPSNRRDAVESAYDRLTGRTQTRADVIHNINRVFPPSSPPSTQTRRLGRVWPAGTSIPAPPADRQEPSQSRWSASTVNTEINPAETTGGRHGKQQGSEQRQIRDDASTTASSPLDKPLPALPEPDAVVVGYRVTRLQDKLKVVIVAPRPAKDAATVDAKTNKTAQNRSALKNSVRPHADRGR
ncbi:hypothetical protein EV217_5074 [Phyllobacterium myrsinacearum]|uniref:hypothetical protein n=1 Tax=Phyllobacterium myrsinacearum TaxID=28101 RepID=UPI001029B183|nr:hypothetical protein [Phyllobacterium myrsinacearum]RZS76843.1 hypothetical protein EV217_5074 [Phyllobacterium myrsinacearum]